MAFFLAGTLSVQPRRIMRKGGDILADPQRGTHRVSPRAGGRAHLRQGRDGEAEGEGHPRAGSPTPPALAK